MIYRYGIQYVKGPRQSGKTGACKKFLGENEDKDAFIVAKNKSYALPYFPRAEYKGRASSLINLYDAIIIFEDFYYIDSVSSTWRPTPKADMKDIFRAK